MVRTIHSHKRHCHGRPHRRLKPEGRRTATDLNRSQRGPLGLRFDFSPKKDRFSGLLLDGILFGGCRLLSSKINFCRNNRIWYFHQTNTVIVFGEKIKYVQNNKTVVNLSYMVDRYRKTVPRFWNSFSPLSSTPLS